MLRSNSEALRSFDGRRKIPSTRKGTILRFVENAWQLREIRVVAIACRRWLGNRRQHFSVIWAGPMRIVGKNDIETAN